MTIDERGGAAVAASGDQKGSVNFFLSRYIELL
jgi:hypothetical protein